MTILLCIGYIIGGNKALVKHYLPYITGAAIGAVAVLIAIYIRHYRRKKLEELRDNS